MTVNYQPLEQFLRATPQHIELVTLSFQQIEMILGDHLPQSHLSHRQWWENQTNPTDRAQARAWQAAGFSVAEVNRAAIDGWVSFAREGE